MESPSFGVELRRLRTSAGLSLDELARRAGYTKGHVSRIENGQKSPSEQFARMCDTVLGAQGILIGRAVAGPALCPYPGLASFSAPDARWFFGRDRVVAELVSLLGDRLTAGHPAVVLGPSGAGKSSLLRAGLAAAVLAGALPTSQPGTPAVLYLTPTGQPLKQLRVHDEARPLGTYALVIVDQFEELFTLCEDEKDRAEFVERLCGLPAVIGMRADFYGHCLGYPLLVEALRVRAFPLAPMTAEQLREAITAPARDVGLTVEPGLVELLLRDLDSATGALPLLAHALRATWQQRENGVLTVAGYQRTGGIRGAVAATAERVFNGLTEPQQEDARRVLLRLVRVGEGEDHTRRPAPREELADAAEIVEAFTRARLLTVSATQVELSHEGVLRAWPRLQAWIAEDRDLLRVRQQLTAAALEWRDGRDPHLLYRGARLVAAQELGSVGPAEQEFLGTSIARQRRRTWRLRALTAAMTVVTLLVTGVAVFAFQQRAAAQRESEQARSGQLAAAAAAARAQGHVETANLLAAEAFRLGREVPERRSDLLSAQTEFLAARMPVTPAGASPRLGQSIAPDGTVLTFDAARRIQLWKDRKLRRVFYIGPGLIRAAVTDGTLVAAAKDTQVWFSDGRRLTFHDQVQGLALHGKTLVLGDNQGVVRYVDVPTGRITSEVQAHGAPISAVAFDGQTVATAGEDHTVRVLGANSRVFRVGEDENMLALAIAPNGTRLVAAGHDRVAWSWNLATGQGGRLQSPKVAGSALTSVAFSPDSRVFAVAGDDFRTDVWGTNKLFALGGHTAPVRGVGFIDGGHTLVTSSEDGSTALWDLRRGSLVGGEGQQHRSVAFVENGVVTSGTEPQPLLWSPETREVIGRFVGHTAPAHHVAATADGRLLASLSNDRSVRLWDPRTRQELARFALDGPSCGLAVSKSGRYLAVSLSSGTVWVRRDDGVSWRVRGTGQAASCGLAFNHSETRLAFGSDDNKIRLVDLNESAQPAELGSHNDSVRNLAFGKDETLASISHDTRVKVWQTRATLTGLTGITNAIAFNDDATLLAASGDGAIRLWRKENGDYRPYATLSGHQQLVDSIAFRGNTLASISNDGTLRLWNLDEEQVRREVCVRNFDAGRSRWSRYAPGAPSAC